MKRYLDGILHLYDAERTKMTVPKLLNMAEDAEPRLSSKEAE